MSIKIKRGVYGYYVDDHAPGDTVPKEQRALRLNFTQEGMQCPLGSYPTLYVTDTQGRELKFIGNKDKFLERVSTQDKQLVEEFELDEENGAWFFLQGVEVTEPMKRK